MTLPPTIVFLAQLSSATGKHNVLSPGAAQGRHIEWLFWFIFIIIVSAYVLTVAAFSLASARTLSFERGPIPVFEDEEGDRRARWAVGSAIAITVILLFVILGFSVANEREVYAVAPVNPVTIKLTGHQWWWEVQYVSSEADRTITTANEIHVPVGQTVVVVTSSADVIHSFWAPSITGKRDLIPGISSAFSFRVEQPGVYRGQCAEFCGLQHAHMAFSVVAESPEQFAAWEDQQLQDAHQPSDPQQQRGYAVFMTHACIMCHTIRGSTAASRYGPDLTHLMSRTGIAAETLPNVTGALAGWIVDPQQIKPGNHMAGNPLPAQDLQALLAYLQSLQ